MHVTSIVCYDNRAVAVCSCSGSVARERFGDRAAHLAQIDCEKHLAEVSQEPELKAFEGWTSTTLGFFAKLETLSIEEPCPVCHTAMSLEPGALDEVQCRKGHLFTLQVEGDTAGLFPDRAYEASVVSDGVSTFSTDEEVTCPDCGETLIDSELLENGNTYEYVLFDCPNGHTWVVDFDGYTVTVQRDSQYGPFNTE